MGRNTNLPVILGCYDKADKVAMWMKPKNMGGRTLVIARLKDYVERGSQNINTRDLESICCELNFCNLETLMVFLMAASEAYYNWKEEEDLHHFHGEDRSDARAGRSDIEKCIIEKILDEDIRKAKARENK